jgi:hypothetical protein
MGVSNSRIGVYPFGTLTSHNRYYDDFCATNNVLVDVENQIITLMIKNDDRVLEIDTLTNPPTITYYNRYVGYQVEPKFVSFV